MLGLIYEAVKVWKLSTHLAKCLLINVNVIILDPSLTSAYCHNMSSFYMLSFWNFVYEYLISKQHIIIKNEPKTNIDLRTKIFWHRKRTNWYTCSAYFNVYSFCFRIIYWELCYYKRNVYCRRPGPYHLLNERYRQPTHDSKHWRHYNAPTIQWYRCRSTQV